MRSYLLVWHGIRANPTIGISACGVTPSPLLNQFLLIVFAAPTYCYIVILHFFSLHNSDICSSWRFCNPAVPGTLQIAASLCSPTKIPFLNFVTASWPPSLQRSLPPTRYRDGYVTFIVNIKTLPQHFFSTWIKSA